MDFCGRVLPLTETDKDLDGIFLVLNRTTADFGALTEKNAHAMFSLSTMAGKKKRLLQLRRNRRARKSEEVVGCYRKIQYANGHSDCSKIKYNA